MLRKAKKIIDANIKALAPLIHENSPLIGIEPSAILSFRDEYPELCDESLVAKAQQLQATVKPLVGPSSILLALMGSGLNGQSFAFHGYLPIEEAARNEKIEAASDAVSEINATITVSVAALLKITG